MQIRDETFGQDLIFTEQGNLRFVVTSYAVERLAAAPGSFLDLLSLRWYRPKSQKSIRSGGSSHKHANN